MYSECDIQKIDLFYFSQKDLVWLSVILVFCHFSFLSFKYLTILVLCHFGMLLFGENCLFNFMQHWNMFSGVIGVPGGVVGHIIAGILVNRFKMKTPTIYKLNVFYCLIVCAASPIVLLSCRNRNVAGITVPYQ